MLEDNPQGTAHTAPPGLEGPSYCEDGVDLTLIRWMLSLTPAERLRALQNAVRSILRLRSLRDSTPRLPGDSADS